MPGTPICRLSIKNYGCIKDASFDLSQLHAFIGPNDSGKSTILRAVSTLVRLASDRIQNDGEMRLLVESAKDPDFVISIRYNDGQGYEIYATSHPRWAVDELILPKGKKIGRDPSRRGMFYTMNLARSADLASLRARLKGVRMLRLDPDSLRAPSRLIPDHELSDLFSERGSGLAGVYDAIVNRDVESFLGVQAEARKLFPTMHKLQLRNVSSEMKTLEIELTDGKRVPAELMSEGLLYYLAFAALPYIEPTSMLLVEEPENGLHPARIAEVMRILKEISKTTQVLIATHSPLVVNELEPEQVSVVTRRPEEGTRVTPVKDTHNFEERSKVYALGELWLSYADGTYEEQLVPPRGGTP